MVIRNLTKKLPYPIRQSLKYIYGAIPLPVRYGKLFRDTYKFLQKSQWWSREKLEDYQIQQLKKLLNHAYEYVPYYRRIFDERGLKPKHIQTFSDLKHLPYLTKNDLKQNFKDLIASNINVICLKMVNTSGTSGKPLQFYWHDHEVQKEWAFTCHHWSHVGYKPGDPLIQLRGAIIEGDKPFHYDPIARVLRLSPRIDSKKVVNSYIEKIQSCRARFLHGYPSIIGHFALMIKQYNLAIKFNLKAVLFTSENIYQWQRQIAEEIFGCRVFGFYGMTEHVVTAGECEKSTNYHCVPQYGITEIDPVSNEIIGTGFLNFVNPFIRYKTTDIASQPILTGCSHCGREYFPVFSTVEGRLEDFIITTKGVPISPAVITHPFKAFKTIKDTQIIQTDFDNITLKIVPWDEGITEESKNEMEQLCDGLQKILGIDMNIKTEVVVSIERSKSGKFKWIISDVSKNSLLKGTGKI